MSSGERHRRGVAVHEAGHALFCRLLGVAVESVTIEWSGTSHGALIYAGTPPPQRLLLILVAGEAAVAHAERMGWFDGLIQDGAARRVDEADAVEVRSDGENIKAVLEELYPGDQAAQERALVAARERVSTDVVLHWEDIALVANELLRQTTLSGRDVRRLIQLDM